MFCCTLLYVHFSIAIILMGKRELIALLNLSSWCLVMVERLFLTVPRGGLQFVIVVFPDHTHLLFLYQYFILNYRREIVFTFFIRFFLCSHLLEVILKLPFYDLILLSFIVLQQFLLLCPKMPKLKIGLRESQYWRRLQDLP